MPDAAIAESTRHLDSAAGRIYLPGWYVDKGRPLQRCIQRQTVISLVQSSMSVCRLCQRVSTDGILAMVWESKCTVRNLEVHSRGEALYEAVSPNSSLLCVMHSFLCKHPLNYCHMRRRRAGTALLETEALKVLQVQKGWPVATLFGAWSCAEMIRYPWYAIGQFREPPRALTWLR